MQVTHTTGWITRAAVAAALAGLVAAAGVAVSAQGQGQAQNGPPQAMEPQNLDLEGYWVSIVNEDWRWRMVTPAPGDLASLGPLNDAGREVAMAWDPSEDGSCLAYGVGNLMRMPTRLHITWAADDTLQIETDAGQQVRRLYLDEADAPTAPSLQGRSVAQWVRTGGGGGRGGPPPGPAETGTLHVMTDTVSPAWLRRNGVPYSDQATVEEYFDNFSSPFEDGSEWLVVTTIVRDPVYLNGEFITSSHFRREAGANGPVPANWAPTACRS